MHARAFLISLGLILLPATSWSASSAQMTDIVQRIIVRGQPIPSEDVPVKVDAPGITADITLHMSGWKLSGPCASFGGFTAVYTTVPGANQQVITVGVAFAGADMIALTDLGADGRIDRHDASGTPSSMPHPGDQTIFDVVVQCILSVP